MTFEEFTKKETQTDEPRVTLQPASGCFVFNKKATELFPPRDYYTYLVDTEDNRLGIKPTEQDNSSSYKATRSRTAIQLSAVAVLKEYDININQLDSYKRAPVHKRDDIIIIDLNEINTD